MGERKDITLLNFACYFFLMVIRKLKVHGLHCFFWMALVTMVLLKGFFLLPFFFS